MKNKINLNKMKKRFFKVPNKLLEVNLPATAIALYVYLAKMPEDFNPSLTTMCRSLKLSRNTVLKYIEELKKRNMIRMIQQGYENTLTKYEFVDTKEWTWEK